MDNAFKYLEANTIESESAYPYKGFGSSCAYNPSEGQFEVKNFYDVPANSPS
jgi:hypothetical protein